MQRSIVLALLGFLLAAPSMFAQESENHVQAGVFADYFNLSRTSPHIISWVWAGAQRSTCAATCRSRPRWPTTSQAISPRPFPMA